MANEVPTPAPRTGDLTEVEQATLATAARMAIEWHGDQTRKGSAIPYVSHLFQVAGLVLEHGGDADQAAAGFLHDALEDAPTPGDRTERVRRILDEFGPQVLRIVLDCTDTEEHEHAGAKAPWRERKTRYLDHLPTCDARSLLVAACDKRHNLGALVADLRAHGPGYLEHFNADKEEQVWYFENVLKALEGKVPGRLSREMGVLLDEFRELAGAGG
jgi:(p)ppGpp synthase/HD superfamily hydrolase